jgi:hypothetical protein
MKRPPESDGPPPKRQILPGTAGAFAVISLAIAVLLWLVSLAMMQPEGVDDFGIFAILPWTYWMAVAFLSSGFAVSLVRSSGFGGARIAALIVLILLLHATPPIVYGTLRYSWSWKHIGIIDFIQRHGGVDRSIAFLGAYHNWPGFFWLFARLSTWLHYGPIEIANAARFFSVVSNIAYVFLLRTIYRRFSTDDRLVNAAIWVFVCANWVGQDYFSPQAVAYGFYLLILLLCLGPLMPADETALSALGRRIGRLRQRIGNVLPMKPAPSPLLRVGAVIAVSLAMLFVAASHQLTPLILVFSLCSLAVVTPLGFALPVLAGLILVYWVLYPASPFTAVYLPDEVAQLGQTVSDLTETLVDTSAVDPGVAVVVWAGRALTGGVVLLAGLGLVRRLRLGARDGVICALLVAPILTLGATSYGGEAVFRIFFFALPFIAFLCAGLLFPSGEHCAGRLTAVTFGLLSCLLILGFLLSNNGKDRQYRFTQDEVAAALWLYGRAGPQTLLVEGARSYPSQFMNYENFIYLPLSNESGEERAEILADPARILERWFSDPEWQDGYIILTRSQQAYVEAMGVMPKGALDQLAIDLMASPDFLLVYANRDARIFRSTRFIATPPDEIGPRRP